jgi:PAS domain S-box-containing protein
MAPAVPDSFPPGCAGEQLRGLGEALESVLEFVGARAGWVGLRDAAGGLTFPVRRGDVPDSWLTLQQSRGSVWGFAVREGPTLVNDLRPWAPLGEPPLRNLLSCPLGEPSSPAGHVALANKPAGFASQDAAVLQGMAHFLYRELFRCQARARTPVELPPPWRRILDRATEGILIVDDAGALVYANATWLEWTGFAAEELVGGLAPFPFWVSHHDLVRAAGMAGTLPASALPFRRRDQSLFWCRAETVSEQWEGRRVTVAFLQQSTALAPETAAERAGLLAGPRPAEPAGRPTDLADRGPAASPRAPESPAVPAQAVPRAAGPPVAGDLPFGVAVTDCQGRLLWGNAALARLLPEGAVPGELLRAGLEPGPAARLEHLLGQPRHAEPGRMGGLVLRSGDAPLALFWLAVRLAPPAGWPQGETAPGFLMALTDDAEGFALDGTEMRLPAAPPGVDWLPLVLEPGGPIRWWDARWEKLTGLAPRDMDGGGCELMLDWLLPQQHDRDRVADCLHHPSPCGCQLLLDIVTPTGSRPMLCTLLPLPAGVPAEAAEGRTASPRRHWLLLAGEPELFAGPDTPSWGFVRLFARGLRRLLEHHLGVPAGLARLARGRADLPAEVAGWFGDIDASCRRLDRLLDDLDDLARAAPGECRVLSLSAVVREAIEEWGSRRAEAGEGAARPGRDYELRVDLGDEDVPVRVAPRLLRTVLGHLLENAEQALGDGPRQIHVRVWTGDDSAAGAGAPAAAVVRCEVRDTGEGLPVEDWRHVLAPFFSTRGAFARDPAHAAHEATGLGLTVCRHLLALVQGHLELRSAAAQGTTAIITLPPADRPAGAAAASAPAGVRADPPAGPHGAHTHGQRSPAPPAERDT